MIYDCKDIINKKDILSNYQQKFETKVCTEINFIDFLEEKDVNYERFIKQKCCRTPQCLLIFSIIIVIFNCAGLYFSISRNEGYKQLKQLLEKNFTLVKIELPSEYENKKLVAYLNRDEFESKDDDSCSYIEYSLSLCEREKYAKFCNVQRYSEKKCNYMDYQYFLNKTFTCDLTNFNNKRCNEIQYLDYFYRNEDKKIKYTNSAIKIHSVKDFYFEKIWCKIGNYDIPILFSLFIIMILFIILLIFDLSINKATLIARIKYYIVLTLYMTFYFIFIIYRLLLFGLFIFSTIVSLASPIAEIDDSFFNSQDGENIEIRANELWNEKKIYAFIYCGINLFLLIFVANLSSYEALLYKYLTFDFGDNSNSKIIRKASIKIGKNNYDFEIIQNKNIYLRDRRKYENYYFKEIIYDNNILYLKFNNIGIKDQLGWIEYNYPIINNGFEKLFLYLKSLISIYILSYVILPKFQFNDDIIYNYFLHLFDLGYKPYLYDYLQKFGHSQILLYNLIKYILIVIGILIIYSLFKLAFYGGFSNIVLIMLSLFISIFITLIILVFLALSFLLFVYNFICLFVFSESKISFVGYLGSAKLIISIILYLIQFICIYELFPKSIKLSIYLNSVRKETKKLENGEFSSDEAFKFKALNNKNYIISALDTDNISKQLFYIKKHDENPISNFDLSSNLLVEQNQEELLDKKKKLKLYIFKKNKKIGLSRNVLLIIIIRLFSLGFIIIALSNSINNYKYYKELRAYIIENYILTSYNNTLFDINLSMDAKNELPKFTQFWCDFGNVESVISNTYLIFIILNICFQIIQYLINIGRIKLDVKKGKSYYIIISLNSLFFVIFMIFYPLLLYLFLYSIIIVWLSPFYMDSNILSKVFKDFESNRYEKLWRKRFIVPIINILFTLFLYYFNYELSIRIKALIIIYLNFEKDKKSEKNTSVVINNNTYNVKIISNEILYLKEKNLGTILN